tara:strand:+ start:188 stop:688 length:501 start_codon:yes stop_codon:yes gene_type:complete
MFYLKKFKKDNKKISSIFKILIWEICSLLFFRSKISILNYSTKVWLLRKFGASIGNKLIIKRDVHIKSPWKLTIGDNVWIGEKVWIDNISIITIGSNVCISQGVKMNSGNHNYKIESFDLICSPINIGSNIWIGCFSIILPGSNVPSNTIINAGGIFPKNYTSKSI